MRRVHGHCPTDCSWQCVFIHDHATVGILREPGELAKLDAEQFGVFTQHAERTQRTGPSPPHQTPSNHRVHGRWNLNAVHGQIGCAFPKLASGSTYSLPWCFTKKFTSAGTSLVGIGAPYLVRILSTLAVHPVRLNRGWVAM